MSVFDKRAFMLHISYNQHHSENVLSTLVYAVIHGHEQEVRIIKDVNQLLGCVKKKITKN